MWWNQVLVPRRRSPFPQLENFGAVPEPETLGLLDLHASVLGMGLKLFDIVLRNTPRSDMDLPDRMGRTALHLAAQRGDVSMVKELLLKGADPDLEDNRGFVPLMLWAENHPVHNWSREQPVEICENMLDFLGTRKAVNNINYEGCSVSHYVLNFDSGIVAALEKLKSLGANFDDKHHSMFPLITRAINAKKCTSQVIPWLLENGCDINCRTSRGNSSTMAAVLLRNLEAIDQLLLQGADYTFLSKGQQNLLHFAAAHSDLKTLEVLCQHPLERLCLDAKNSQGWTPLYTAWWRRDRNCDWSEWAHKKPDKDPIQWYNAFWALYRHIAASQGLQYPEEYFEGCIVTRNNSVETVNEGEEKTLQTTMPGSYPKT